jgi:hypothetical protein
MAKPTAKKEPKEPVKGLTDDQKEFLRSVLQPIVDERFKGNHTKAAEEMGIPQPQLSQILMGKKSARSAGVQVLSRIRWYMRMSIDELIGLPPLSVTKAPPAADPTFREYARQIIREELQSELPPPKKGPASNAPPPRPRRRA